MAAMDTKFREFFPKLPKEMYVALQGEDVQIIGIQAPTQLETLSLDNLNVEISAQGSSIEGLKDMVLRRPLKPSSQFLALKPAGENGEVSKSKVVAVMEMFELDHRSDTTPLAEDSVKKTLQSLEVLIKSEDVDEAGIKPQLAQKKWEMRNQLGLGGLADPLACVGWDLGPEMEPILEEDAWEGDGEVPKKKRKSCFSASEQKRQRKAEAERLRDIEGSYTIQVAKRYTGAKETYPMVACWSLSHVTEEHFQEVYFTSFIRGTEKKGTQVLQGSLESSDSLKLQGLQDPEPSVKLYMGILLPTTPRKTICLYPTSCFFISVAKSPPELSKDEAKSYMEQRHAATEGFGTEKRLRINNTLRERMERNCEVADLEKCQGIVQDKVEEQNKEKGEKEKKASQGILPPFNTKAESPDMIYKEGLDAFASKEYWIKEGKLIDDKMRQVVQMNLADMDKLSDRKENDVAACGSYLALQVLKARAAQSMTPPKDPAKVNLLTRKFGVLKCLLIILQDMKNERDRGGKGITRGTLCGALGLPLHHPFPWQLYHYCYDPMVGNKSNRALNKRKTLCALIIWALNLTEALYMDVTRKVQEELKLDTNTLKAAFKYIGCSVEAKKDDVLRIQLVQAPSAQDFASKPPPPPERKR